MKVIVSDILFPMAKDIQKELEAQINYESRYGLRLTSHAIVPKVMGDKLTGGYLLSMVFE